MHDNLYSNPKFARWSDEAKEKCLDSTFVELGKHMYEEKTGGKKKKKRSMNAKHRETQN